MSKQFQTALEEAQRKWMDIDGVISVAQGKDDDGNDCITVYVKEKTKSIEKAIPSSYKDIPVIFEVSGEVQAY